MNDSVPAANDYAKRYRAARAYAGKSRLQIARALDLSESTIKRRESGKENEPPKPHERSAVALLCGVPPEFIEYGFDGVDYTEAQRKAVRTLGEAAAQRARADGARPDTSQERRDQGTPEDPAADAQ